MWLASSSARLFGGGRLSITTKDREGYRVSDVTVLPSNHFIVLLFSYLELQVFFLLCAFFDGHSENSDGMKIVRIRI